MPTRRLLRLLTVTSLPADFRGQHVDPLGGALDLHHRGEAVFSALEHSPLAEGARNHRGLVTGCKYGSPNLGWDQPLAIRIPPTVPAKTIWNWSIDYLIDGIETRVPVSLDEAAHLGDGIAHFGWFDTPTVILPFFEQSLGGCPGCARLPGQNAELDA